MDISNNTLASDSEKKSIYDDENFRKILHRATRSPILWDEFLDIPLPNNATLRGTWDCLSRINQISGIEIPIPNHTGEKYWYHRTIELTDLAEQIMHSCRFDSFLWRFLSSPVGQQFAIQFRISSDVYYCKYDGLDLEEDAISSTFRALRPPKNDIERVLHNTYLGGTKLMSLIDKPFDNDLVTYLSELVLDGVDVTQLDSSNAITSRLTPYESPLIDNENFKKAQLKHILDYANGTTGDGYDLDILKAIVIDTSMSVYHPIPYVSAQVGRLLFSLFTLKKGIPVLNFLPFKAIQYKWENDFFDPETVTISKRNLSEWEQHSPLDITLHQTIYVKMIQNALAEIEEKIAVWERRDQEMQKILQYDSSLNSRQRGLIARALREPEAAAKIRYHQTNHNISYVTARRDLMELTSKGYLTVRDDEKAFEFVGSPNLRSLLFGE